MDVMDGISRPEIIRQVLDEVGALEQKPCRSTSRRCSNSTETDEFTLDLMDGISRPAIKKQAMDAIETEEMRNDFGMFQQPRFIPERRHSLKTAILVEEKIAGAIMKRKANSFGSLRNLFEETLLDRLDGTKRKRCTTKADMLSDEAYASALLSTGVIMTDTNDFGMFDGRCLPFNKYAIVMEEKLAGVVHARSQKASCPQKLHAPKSIRQEYQELTLNNLDGII